MSEDYFDKVSRYHAMLYRTRDNKVRRLRALGLSLEQIGLRFEPPLSRQRVHQILTKEAER